MTCKLIHKLKERGYKQNQIIEHIKNIKFDGRREALTRKSKLFVTQYSDDIQRIKPFLNKHWKLIKNNPYLKQN